MGWWEGEEDGAVGRGGGSSGEEGGGWGGGEGGGWGGGEGGGWGGGEGRRGGGEGVGGVMMVVMSTHITTTHLHMYHHTMYRTYCSDGLILIM